MMLGLWFEKSRVLPWNVLTSICVSHGRLPAMRLVDQHLVQQQLVVVVDASSNLFSYCNSDKLFGSGARRSQEPVWLIASVATVFTATER